MLSKKRCKRKHAELRTRRRMACTSSQRNKRRDFSGPTRKEELFQFESKRIGLVGHRAASDGVDGCDHAALATQHAVGKRHEAAIWRRRRRGAAQLARDRQFIAAGVERA